VEEVSRIIIKCAAKRAIIKNAHGCPLHTLFF
jgi:hypothetical protein